MSIQSYQDQLHAWEKLKEKAPFNVIYTEIRCKYCNSKEISKYGRYKNVQRWWCKECKRKFTDNNTYPGMKVPSTIVSSALSMYYKGISLNAIRKQLEEEYDYYPSDSTLNRWIQRLTVKGQLSIKNHKPEVGNTWIVYETPILIGVKRYWMLDLLDTLTHFLLASTLSSNRNTDDIRILMESAKDKAQKIPEVLITRRTTKYMKGVEQALGADIGQIQIKTFAKEDEMKFSKYWLSMIKKRRIIMRCLKLIDKNQLILKGWMLYYNYYITQESLNGKTPSQAAKIEYQYEANRWIEERK